VAQTAYTTAAIGLQEEVGLQDGTAQRAVLQQVAVTAGGGKLLKALEVVRGGVALEKSSSSSSSTVSH
jgi:hypothetical protein